MTFNFYSVSQIFEISCHLVNHYFITDRLNLPALTAIYICHSQLPNKEGMPNTKQERGSSNSLILNNGGIYKIMIKKSGNLRR